MDNLIRTKTSSHIIPDDLWQTLEDTKKSHIEELINNLERCVSNGWFGAAAELSDSLESSSYIDIKPSWRIRVELERMKRYYYLGFKKRADIANIKVINLLNRFKKKCNKQDFVLWKSTVLGHQSLNSKTPKTVEKLNNICKILRNKTQEGDERNERTSFIKATEGHYWFLKNNKNTFQKAFEEAIKISEEKDRLRSYSYIKILYAERLVLFGDWKKAVQIINEFLLTAHQKQFQTNRIEKSRHFLTHSENFREAKIKEFALQ